MGGEKRIIDFVGKRFGRLIVIKRAENWISSTKKTNVPQWECKCDCGKLKLIRASKLIDGSTVSCGCYMREMSMRVTTPPGQAGLNKLYYVYAKNARDRGYDFNITKEDFSRITKLNCHYCDRIPEQKLIPQGRLSVSTENGTYTYNGIDRMDSTAGYNMANCVPCCGVCNRAKMDLSYTKFMCLVRKIYLHRLA